MTWDSIEPWRAGEPIPEVHLCDVYRIVAVERMDLLLDPEEVPLSVQPLRTNRHVGDREGWDGLWGQMGLDIPGLRKTLWPPIRRTDGLILEGVEDEPFSVYGLGLSAVVVNPRNLNSLWLLDEAQDRIRGDWTIPKLDPSDGLNPELLNGLMDFYSDEAGLSDRTRVSCAYARFLHAFVDHIGHKRLDRAHVSTREDLLGLAEALLREANHVALQDASYSRTAPRARPPWRSKIWFSIARSSPRP